MDKTDMDNAVRRKLTEIFEFPDRFSMEVEEKPIIDSYVLKIYIPADGTLKRSEKGITPSPNFIDGRPARKDVEYAERGETIRRLKYHVRRGAVQ